LPTSSEFGEVDGSRTHLILMDSEVPLPLGHHSKAWYPARDSNPNLNVRSVLSCPLDERDTWYRRGESNSRPLIEGQRSLPLDDAGKTISLVELERIELSPSRLKVERLTIRPQFLILGASGWNRTNCLPIKNRLLILMSFERMVLALGVEPSPCSNLERSGL
jgi:hypothetical protein